jgi:putative flippase GtrA
MKLPAWAARGSVYLTVGGLSTVLHYLVLVVAVEALGAPPVPASVVGFLCGAALNYVLNRRFTFSSQRPHREGAPRFAAMVTVGTGLNTLLLIGLMQLGVFYLLAQMGATIAVMGLNFLLMKHWVFPAPGR